MRMTDEAFEAEVRRRAAVYQQQERRRRRILMTACPVAACLVLVIGAAALRGKSRDMLFGNNVNIAADVPQVNEKNAEKTPEADGEQIDTVPSEKKEHKQSIEREIDTRKPPYQFNGELNLNADAAAEATFATEATAPQENVVPSDAAAEQEILIACQTQMIPKGTKYLDIQVTNQGEQNLVISSVQFMLSQQFADGNEMGYVYRDMNMETNISVAAGATLPFRIALDAYADELPVGRYTLRFGQSEIQFTVGE